MNIERLSPELFRLRGTQREFGILRSSLREVCYGFRVDDFERRIGANAERAEHFLNAMPREGGALWGEPGFVFESIAQDFIDARISLANFRILRAALFETCNGIALFEFQTRMGVELEEALLLLRVIAAQLGLARYG